MTPEELRAEAARLREHARRTLEAAESMERAADALEGQTDAALTVHRASRRTGDMQHSSATRHAISAKLMRKDKNLAAAYEADPTIASLRDLADALGVSVQLLSMIRGKERAATDELKARFRKRFGKDWQ